MPSIRQPNSSRDVTAAGPEDNGAPDLAAPIPPLAQDYLAVLVMTLAGRLNRGASSYYLHHFDIGMTEFRIVLAVGMARGLNISEVATAADVDKASASRSLRLLEARGIVELEQTSTRGRAAIVHLTPEGKALEREVKKAARRRDRLLIAGLSAQERAQATALIQKLIDSVPNMNKD